MSIETAVCSAYIAAAMSGLHAAQDHYRVALIVPSPAKRFGVMTQSYADLGADELPQALGYEAGGVDVGMLHVRPGADGAAAGFEDAVWPVAHFAAGGALIYNATKGGAAVAVLGFDGAYVGHGWTFTLPLGDVLAAYAMP